MLAVITMWSSKKGSVGEKREMKIFNHGVTWSCCAKTPPSVKLRGCFKSRPQEGKKVFPACKIHFEMVYFSL
jgi:hypothetical protein